MANEDKATPASIKPDMLPEPSQTTPEVKEKIEETKPEDPAPEPQKQEDAPAEAPKEEPKPKRPKPPEGYVEAEAYHRQKAENRELGKKLKDLEASSTPEDYTEYPSEAEPSDLDALNKKVQKLETDRELDSVLSLHPIIKEKLVEFEEYRDTKPEYSVEDQAKLFLDSEGLLGGQVRPGLETPTSGPNEPPDTSMTPDEVQEIKDKQPRKWEEMAKAGAFDSVDWKK